MLDALRQVRLGKRPRTVSVQISRRRWLASGVAFGMCGLGVGMIWIRILPPAMPYYGPRDQRASVWRGYLPTERKAWAKEFIPPRPPDAPAGALDLTPFYNVSLVRAAFPGGSDVEAELNSLASLPSGLQVWLGSTFDVRGMIQLDGVEAHRQGFRLAPVNVRNIPIGQRFQRLRVVHATAWPAPEDAEIARYRIQFNDGTTDTIPVRFGRNIHGGWRMLNEPIPAPPEAEIVWRGNNPIASRAGYAVVLYLMTWTNPRPERWAESIDLESTMTDSAVGVVAITVE